MSERALLTRREVAQMLGISVNTLYRWRAAGKAPREVRTPFSHPRWRKCDVELWLRNLAAMTR